MTASSAPESGSLPRRVGLMLRDIKLAHSVFALPFAVLAAFLAAPRLAAADRPGIDWSVFSLQLALIVICMVLARTWAMIVNRLADRRFDAENPRTARRAVASGSVPAKFAFALALGCALLFVAATFGFLLINGNWFPAALSVPVLAWIALYSYTKRFTWACHLFLGGALAASPVAAAIAIDPSSLAEHPGIVAISAMVLFWVAGFDVIYALQDIDFDRESGLRSIPARFGWRRAITLSRVLHGIAFATLIFAARFEPAFGLVFMIACGVGGILLIYEHAILARRGKAGLEMAFFSVNGVYSCLLGLSGCIDALR